MRSNESRQRRRKAKPDPDSKVESGPGSSQATPSDGEFRRLVGILDRLRGPGGCPWDREQTFASLRRYVLEEAYEVADALDREDPEALREELGDLLLQIVFLARIAREQGSFDVEGVARGIADKLVRRHPHVFGDATAATAAEVTRNWEAIKRSEKSQAEGTDPSRLDGLPRALPALARARLLGERAAQIGFDWERPDEVVHKLEEELGELRRALGAGDPARIREELGDLLFTAVMLGRKSEVDAEAALEGANRKFQRRFARIERELGRLASPAGPFDPETLERLWREAKEAEGPDPAR